MAIVANTYSHVIGIDTHARTHTLAVLDTRTAQVVATHAFATTPAGLARAVAWILRHTLSVLATLVVIEGAGSYGATMMRTTTDAHLRVVEPSPIPKGLRAGRGKSDPVDAELIARSVLPLDTHQLREPRTDQGVRAAIRVLLAARDLLNIHRTATRNHLTALLRTIDVGLDARAPLTDAQVAAIARWRAREGDIATTTARAQARDLARMIRAYDTDLQANKHQLAALVQASPAAPLLDEVGIGTVTAATIYASWSHAGRIRSEAAFASLAGTSPVPASSGNTTRHRLNRGGDRHLNRALHAITLTRMRIDPDTRAYVQRRRAQGHTLKEIRRSLKRYLARHLYRELTRLTA